MTVALALLAGACVVTVDPGDDELGEDTGTATGSETTGTTTGSETTGTTTSDTTTDTTGDTTTGDTTTDTTSDTTTDTDTDTTTGGGDCNAPVFLDLFSLTINLDNEPIGANLDLDLACTVVDDASPALLLDCPQFELSIEVQGEVAADIPDPTGSTVHVRLVTEDGWFLGSKWLRLDFVGASKTAVLIDGVALAPEAPTAWIPPWGLAIVDECAAIDDGCGEWVGQTLGVARDNQTLELLQGGTGSIAGGTLEMWVERAWRYQTIGPACDAPSSWAKLAIVSDNLVESEVCIPGETDPCGTGLECCYPCGIPDCDFVCTPEDPDTMTCPPPPP